MHNTFDDRVLNHSSNTNYHYSGFISEQTDSYIWLVHVIFECLLPKEPPNISHWISLFSYIRSYFPCFICRQFRQWLRAAWEWHRPTVNWTTPIRRKRPVHQNTVATLGCLNCWVGWAADWVNRIGDVWWVCSLVWVDWVAGVDCFGCLLSWLSGSSWLGPILLFELVKFVELAYWSELIELAELVVCWIG